MKKNDSILSFKKIIFAAFLALLLLSGCKKEQPEQPDLPNKSVAKKSSQSAISPVLFDWETVDWMPYPTNIIPPPWTGQGSLYSIIDPDVLTDRRASDGWTLVYSTFTYSEYTNNPYFILYNKYRGLMRIFIYVNNSSFAASSYLQDGITLVNNQYSILNFAGFDIIDASQKQLRFDKVESAPKDGSAPFATFKWYMLQYEFAYDPTIVPTTSAYPPQFSFYINSINLDKVTLGGTQKGTLKGTIGSSASSSSNFFSTITPILKPFGTGILAGLGSQFFTKNATSDTSNSLGLPNGIFKDISKGLSSALSSATGSLPGAVTNILSAIIGGNSGSAMQTVSLNLSTQISLSGSISSTTSFPSSPTSLYIPGSIKADANGNYNVQNYIPLYNEPLGVFNLSNKPTVSEIIEISNPPQRAICNYHCDYAIDKNSFQILWNPAVTSIASITDLTEEVITSPSGVWSLSGTTGRKESYSGSTIYTGKDKITVNFKGYYDGNIYLDGPVYVRISFKVVPNNGAPTSTIVKTFAVNVNRTVIDQYYCPTCPAI